MTSVHTEANWQSAFVELMPEIEQWLHRAFRHLDAEAAEDAIEEGVVNCLLSYRRLHEQDRANSVTAENLAFFAAKQVRSGRIAGGRLNSKEPLAVYAQRRRGIRVEQLNVDDLCERNWIDAMVQDRRSSVLDQVAARLDVAAWLATLCRRTRQIAADLAKGCTTSEVAKKHGVTAGRVSQLRRELHDAWRVFQGELAPAQL